MMVALHSYSLFPIFAYERGLVTSVSWSLCAWFNCLFRAMKQMTELSYEPRITLLNIRCMSYFVDMSVAKVRQTQVQVSTVFQHETLHRPDI